MPTKRWQSAELLVDLIEYTTEARRRMLSDLPLSLYADGADLEPLRAAIQSRDTARAEQLRSNVVILAREMERRALTRIDDASARLVVEQSALGDALAREQRIDAMGLTAVVLAVSIALLGFGTYRFILRPLRELRTAATAVAGGDLDAAVQVTSRDEVGELAADFALMLERLRASRDEIDRKNAELQSWNETLASEVARKTEHLERALEDLRRTQRGLVHAAKMASVGTLAGGIAHEFTNVIGGIRGCAVEALEDEADPERRETLDVIVRAATRGAAITEQLLRFSRQKVQRIERIDVAAVLVESLRLAEPSARRSGVRVITAIEERLSARADADALHQVFLNLLTNAVQAMPDGGELRVSLERLDGDVLICVRDSGVGIPADAIEHVFEPFWTSRDREPDPERRGTGLGLSVSYGLVEAHGGSIEVESEPGQGSTFSVRLPLAGPAGSEADDDDDEDE